MYGDHIRACNDACQASPENTVRMVRFVLATIQQQLESVPDIMADFEQLGADSKFAFGAKARGLDWLAEHGDDLYWDALACMDDDIELMLTFLRVPGLGMVKAGFACQLFAGTVGCLDVHNIRMYGLSTNDLRIAKGALPVTVRRRVTRYVELCRKLDGAVSLWAAWCEYKAAIKPVNWPEGAESVSVLHIEACGGSWWHTLPPFMEFDFEPRFRAAA